MERTTDTKKQVNVKVKWRCPSNIAIVKYWGKMGNQLPRNSSLSLTLANSYTEVEAELSPKSSDDLVELDYYFEGKLNDKFGKRVALFLEDNLDQFPFLEEYAVSMRSINSFPHSAGIASSASSFGAIALAMLDLRYTLEGNEIDQKFYHQASYLARLGSGSACRSLFPSFALWGENTEIEGSSNEFAIPISDVHPVFQNMHDAILIVEDKPKKISSTIGHSLMNNHPFAEKRFEQANGRTAHLVEVLKEGDIESFIQLCESEALTLHAMMMTSVDYYILMKPATLTIIEKLMQFRMENVVPVSFTLDAGPNIHVLYPEKYKEDVEEFIQTELKDTYKNVIFDHEGQGPQKLNA
ncbi:MAG: diphosphomevalonate decarboxylase [Crocinitomicaceae bacterium]